MRSAVPPPVPSMDEFEGKLNDAMDALWDTAESRQTEAEARLVGYRQSLLSDPRIGAMDRAFSKIVEHEAEDGRHLIATVRTFLKQVDPPPLLPPLPPPLLTRGRAGRRRRSGRKRHLRRSWKPVGWRYSDWGATSTCLT